LTKSGDYTRNPGQRTLSVMGILPHPAVTEVIGELLKTSLSSNCEAHRRQHRRFTCSGELQSSSRGCRLSAAHNLIRNLVHRGLLVCDPNWFVLKFRLLDT